MHPVSVCVGGFWRVPRREELLENSAPRLSGPCRSPLRLRNLSPALRLPEFTPDYECVALSHPREYGMNGGHIISSSGLDIAIKEFEQTFLEEHVAHSTALQAVRAEEVQATWSVRWRASI